MSSTAAPAAPASAASNENPKFRIKHVRLSFSDTLFTGKKVNKKRKGQNVEVTEFAANFIMSKPEHADVIKQLVEAAKGVAAKKWGNYIPKVHKLPFKNGADCVNQKTGERYAGYDETKVYFNAKTEMKPNLVGPLKDADGKFPTVDATQMWPGSMVNVSITLAPYEFTDPQSGATNRGVGVYLGGVQICGDQTGAAPFAGRTENAEETFEDEDTGSSGDGLD